MVIGLLGLKATVAEQWWHDSYLCALSFGDPKDPEIGTEQFKMSKSTYHVIVITFRIE